MLIALIMLLILRLIGFFLKVAGNVIKIIFRILIIPVLVITALSGYPIVAVIAGVIVIILWCIFGSIKKT